MTDQSEVYITDDQLCMRWKCSKMTLWRYRKQGALPKPIKIGGRKNSRNLTPMGAVVVMERGSADG